MIRLLLVDGEAAVRKGLRMRLAAEPDIAVVGEASSGEKAFRLVRHLTPDVLLLDLAMSPNWIETTGMLHQRSPDMAIVILSIHDDVGTRARAQAAGAAAFVSKAEAVETLLAAIRDVAAVPLPPVS